MDGSIVMLIVLAAVALVPLLWFVAVYNRLVSLLQHIRESWAGVDVELKRRYDLIPNLVRTVKGYAAHESELLERVTRLRAAAAGNTGTPQSQAQDETQLALSLKQLFAVAENYPALKADKNFLQLQDELSNTEDRIAAARRFFNGNVRDYNQACQVFPSSVVAGVLGFKLWTYFELSDEAERAVPSVSQISQGQGAAR